MHFFNPREISQKPERWFAVFALLAGSLFALITPPFQAPDEHTHLFRAYQIAEGGLIAGRTGENAGGTLPRSIERADGPFSHIRFNANRKLDLQAILDSLDEPLAPADRIFVGFNNTAVFSPLPYIPQALALILAIPLELSPVLMMYLGRLANVALAVALVFVAIRIAPVFKRVIILIALMPMTIFQTASLSADGVTIAVSLLFAALVLRCINAFGAFYVWTLLCAAALSLCKPTYAVLTLLVFIIPLSHHGAGAQKWLKTGLIPATGFAAAGAWALLNRDVYVPIKWIGGIDPSAQMTSIMDAPMPYLGQVFMHYAASWHGYLELIVGRLGWVDTYLPWWFWNSYAALLVLLALIDSAPKFGFSPGQRVVSLCTMIVGIITVTTAIYICCNPLGGNVVQGVQGRYFIPFVPAALLIFYNRKFLARLQTYAISPVTIQWRIDAALAIWLIFSTALTLTILAQRYYG